MVDAKRRVRIAEQGRISLPADMLRKHHLQSGDEVTIEDTDQGMLIAPQGAESPVDMEAPPTRFTQPSPEELARRRDAVDRALAVRAQTPSIAPLTTADLVHMSRDDNFWYGEEEPTSDGSGR